MFFFPLPARQIYFWLLTSLVSCDGASSQPAAPSRGAARMGRCEGAGHGEGGKGISPPLRQAPPPLGPPTSAMSHQSGWRCCATSVCPPPSTPLPLPSSLSLSLTHTPHSCELGLSFDIDCIIAIFHLSASAITGALEACCAKNRCRCNQPRLCRSSAIVIVGNVVACVGFSLSPADNASFQ